MSNGDNQMVDQDIAMFGMDEQSIHEQYINSITTQLSGIEMTVMSILSDAQHVLEHGDNERARKYMNIAKYILSEMIDQKRSR